MILLTLPIYPLKIGLASSLDETQCCEGIGVLLILDSALLVERTQAGESVSAVAREYGVSWASIIGIRDNVSNTLCLASAP